MTTTVYPEQGWHEHDPFSYLVCIETCVEGALESFLALGHAKDSIKCVGITNQRETTICWDRNTGQPLYNAVVWPDSRNRDTVTDLRDKAEHWTFTTPGGQCRGEDGVRALTGLPFS